MKGSLIRTLVYVLGLLLYILFGMCITSYATNGTLDRIILLLGEKAKSTAVVAANNYSITDAEVEELLQLEFKDVPYHPANERLADMFYSNGSDKTFQYAYIMKMLDENKIKYSVTDENAEFYGTEVGKPLDIMWLVDYPVGMTRDEILAEDEDYYMGTRRYSYVRPDDLSILQDRKPAVSLTRDEYGKHASGMAPIYTDEGNYVGMLGVDVYMAAFEESMRNVQWLLSLVFILPSIALSGLFIAMYLRSRKRLRAEAYTDGLTLIKNRKYINTFFPEIVNEHYKNITPLSVIMVDVDHFKQFNDKYGHQEGDRALVEISEAIGTTLRKCDAVCRYGGEELLVILRDSGPEAAERVAKRIQSAVMDLGIAHGSNSAADVVTVSQGVFTAVPSKTDSGKDFIKYADKGLYEAKKNGRNKYTVIEMVSCTA